MLYRDLVDERHLPARLLRDVDRFDWDDATLKVNWALDSPIPWSADGAHGAGTVHLGVDDDGLVDVAADLSVGRMPRHPFLLLGQMTTADPTRSPAGTESVWAYTHLPRHLAGDEGAVARAGGADGGCRGAGRARLPAPPGSGRQVQTPRRAAVRRPQPEPRRAQRRHRRAAPAARPAARPAGSAGRRPRCRGSTSPSASAHPGGGVHGACGWNAAVAALRPPRAAGCGAPGPRAHGVVAGAARPRRLTLTLPFPALGAQVAAPATI